MAKHTWQIPPAGGHMDAADGIYYQNMTMNEVTARLKKDDLIIIPIGSLDYMVRLHDDIIERFPPGKLPEASQVTQRFTQEDVDELIKGPLNGGKHLYTIAWPPI